MINNFKIKDLNNNEKPRERLVYKGANALADYELLAILLHSGGTTESALELAQKILSKFGGFKGLINADIVQLQTFKNVGIAKASTIKASCEIALRINTETETKIKIQKPEHIFKVLKKDLFEKTKEHFYVISLDTRNYLIAVDLVSIGTVNETLVHPREVFKQALSRNAVSIIVAHNHPSGQPDPSPEDIIVTERVAKVGIALGIPLLDHVIISNNLFISLKALNLFSKGGEEDEKTDN